MSQFDPEVKLEVQLLYGGISAVEFKAIVQLLQLPTLSWQLKIALYCFSTNLPLSILLFLFSMLTESVKVKKRTDKFVDNFLASLSIIILLSFILGLIFTLFHLNFIAGIIFSVSSFISIICWFTVVHESK